MTKIPFIHALLKFVLPAAGLASVLMLNQPTSLAQTAMSLSESTNASARITIFRARRPRIGGGRFYVVLVLALLLASASAQTIPHYVTLTWNWTGTGAATYNVYRGTTSGGETLLAGGVLTTIYTDNTAVIGTKYYYTVTATVGGVESSPSTEVAAQIVVPPAPTNPATAIH